MLAVNDGKYMDHPVKIGQSGQFVLKDFSRSRELMYAVKW